MDVQTKIANALADFDHLLVQGLNLDAALRIAATENDVTERVLATRASRDMPLEERRQLVIAKAKAERQWAAFMRQKPVCQDEEEPSLFAGASKTAPSQRHSGVHRSRRRGSRKSSRTNQLGFDI